MRGKPLISAGARIFIAIVLLAALVLKVSHSQPTPVRGQVGIGAFEDLLLLHDVIPERLIFVTARAVLLVELVLALWLLSHWRARLAASSALGLMVAFSAYGVAVYVRNGDPECGCFGVLSAESLRMHLVQNSLLALLRGVGAVWATARSRRGDET